MLVLERFGQYPQKLDPAPFYAAFRHELVIFDDSPQRWGMFHLVHTDHSRVASPGVPDLANTRK